MDRSPSIRRIVWEQRLRSSVPIAIAVSIIGGLLIAVGLYTAGSTTERTGVVTGIIRESSEHGKIRTEILVKLDAGNTVKAHFSHGAPPRKGERIALTEIETLLFGIRRYRFKSHLGAEPTLDATQ